MIDQQDTNLKRLLQRVEETVGFQMKTPRNFDYLSRLVQELTRQSLSASTLKRIWGYTHSQWGVSEYSYDVLCKLVGYCSWQAFCRDAQQDEKSMPSSQNVVVRRISSRSLTVGDMLDLRWSPDRHVIIEYDGQDQFHVVTAVNSKLKAGDMFLATAFVEGQPLLLGDLRSGEMPPVDYQCGMSGGIRWQLILKKVAR